MAELGPDSLEEHQRIIDEIGNQHWADVALVGGDFLHVDHPYRRFSNAQEAGDWLKQASFANTYFLIKGSRNMQMEKVLEG
jgi:UDP-N-acetylmuramoyl-tripeptide--D-alanyl-D-alanine ligase